MELLIGFVIGLVLGMVAGFIPGLHTNTIVSFLLGLDIAESYPELSPIIITTMFSSYLIFSIVPSIFFAIPDETIVSALAGHEMVKKGRGIAAIKAMVGASVLTLIFSIGVFPITLSLFPIIYNLVKPYMFYILLFASLFLILRSRNSAGALGAFLLSGLLGIFAFRMNLQDPFLPLFSGFFAISNILYYKKTDIPKQKDEKINPKTIISMCLIGTILGFFADLIPGISSPAQVAIFATAFIPLTTVGYLALLSSIGLSESLFAFSTAASINRARVGVVANLAKIVNIEQNLLLLLTVFIIGTVMSSWLLYLLRKKITSLANVNFSIVSKFIIAYLFLFVLLLDGIVGVFVLALSTAVGAVTIRSNTERTNMMGAIILPTMLLLV